MGDFGLLEDTSEFVREVQVGESNLVPILRGLKVSGIRSNIVDLGTRPIEVANIAVQAAADEIERLRAMLPKPKEWDEALEGRAKAIYDAMEFDEPHGTKPAWVRHGNSLKQTEARLLAWNENRA